MDALAEHQRLARAARMAAREERRRESRGAVSSRAASSRGSDRTATPPKTPPWVKARRVALKRAELEAVAEALKADEALRPATPPKPVAWDDKENPQGEKPAGCCTVPVAVRRLRDKAEDADRPYAKVGVCCGVLVMCALAVLSVVGIVGESMDTCLGRLDGTERPYLLAQLPRPGEVSITDMALYRWLFWDPDCSDDGILPCLRSGEVPCDSGCYKMHLQEEESPEAASELREAYPPVWAEGIIKVAQAVAASGMAYFALGLIFTSCACHRLKKRPSPKDSAYMDELGRPCTGGAMIGDGILNDDVKEADRMDIALRAHRLKVLRMATTTVMVSTMVMVPFCYLATAQLMPALYSAVDSSLELVQSAEDGMDAARQVLAVPSRMLDELELLNSTREAGFESLPAMQTGLDCAERALAQPPLPVVDLLLSDLTNATGGLSRLGGELRGTQFSQYEVAVASLKPSLTNLSRALDEGATIFDNLVRSTALPRLSLEARVQFEGLAGGLGFPYNEATSFSEHSAVLHSDMPTAVDLTQLADKVEAHSASSSSAARESLLEGLLGVKNSLTGVREASSQLRTAAAGFTSGASFVSTVSLFALSGQVSTAVASLADTSELIALIDQAEAAVQNFDGDAAADVLAQLVAATDPGNRAVPGLLPRERPELMHRLALVECATTANATAAYAAMDANVATIPPNIVAHLAALNVAADSVSAVCNGSATVVDEICRGTADLIVGNPAACDGAATWNGLPQLPTCAHEDAICGMVGMVSCDGSCVPPGSALPVCDENFASMPDTSAASCFSGCTYTAYVADVLPVCDLDIATDGTADCPAGCYNVASNQPICDLDRSTDQTSACPPGCADPLYSVDAVQDAFANAVVEVEARDPSRAEAELVTLRAKLTELDFDALRAASVELGRRKAAVAAAITWEPDARAVADALEAQGSSIPVTYSISTGVQCDAQGTTEVDTLAGCEAAATALGFNRLWDVAGAAHMTYRLINCMYMPAENKVFWNPTGDADRVSSDEQAVCKGGLGVALDLAIADLDVLIHAITTFHDDATTWHSNGGGSTGFPPVPAALTRLTIEGIRSPLVFADDIADPIRTTLLSSVLAVNKPDSVAIVATVRAGQIATEIPPDSTCTGQALVVNRICEGTASEVPAVCNGVFDLTGTRCALNAQASACALNRNECPLAPSDTPVCTVSGWTSAVSTCPFGCCQRQVSADQCTFTAGIPSSCGSACTYTSSNPGPESCVPTSDCRVGTSGCTYVAAYTPICDFDPLTDPSLDGLEDREGCPLGCDYDATYTPDCVAAFAAAADTFSDKCPGGCTYWSAPLADAEALPLDPNERLDLRLATAAVNDVVAFEALSSHWPTLRAAVADATEPVQLALDAIAELHEGVVGMPPKLVPPGSCGATPEDSVCGPLAASNDHRMMLDEGTCHGTATTLLESCTGTADTIQRVPASCRGEATWNDLPVLPCPGDDLQCGVVGMVECDGHCVPPHTALPQCDVSFARAPVQSGGWCFSGCVFTAAVAAWTPTCDLDLTTDDSAECPAGCIYAPTRTPNCDLDAETDGTALCPAGCSGRAPGCMPHPPQEAGAHAAAVDVADYSLRLGVMENFLALMHDGDAVSTGRSHLAAWEAQLAELERDPFFSYDGTSEEDASLPEPMSILGCGTAECFTAAMARWETDWIGLQEALYSPPVSQVDDDATPATESAPEPEPAAVAGSGLSLQAASLSLLPLLGLSAMFGAAGTMAKREPLRLAALLGLTFLGPVCLGQAALLTPLLLAGSDLCGGGPAALSTIAFEDTHLGYNDELSWATNQEYTDAVSHVYDVSSKHTGDDDSFTLPNTLPDPRRVFGLPLGAPPIILEIEVENGANTSGVELSSPAVLLHTLLNGCESPAARDGYVVPPTVGVDEISAALQTSARSNGAQAIDSIREKLRAIGGASAPMGAHLDSLERELTQQLPAALVAATDAAGCASLRSDLDAFGDAMCCEVLGALHGMVLWLALLGCGSGCGSACLCCGSGAPELRQPLPLSKEEQAMEEWRRSLAGSNAPRMPNAPGSPGATQAVAEDDDAWMYS